MEGNEKLLVNTCGFMDVKPIMMELPYPPVQVRGKNPQFANLLSMDYCGQVSELSAIAQYINNENILSAEHCPVAKTLLGIAMAEMIHLQKLAELIILLGGKVDFSVMQKDGRRKAWSADYLNLSENVSRMIQANIEGERAAINQYRMHMKMINDSNIQAVLARIVKDEEYHIMVLRAL